MKLCARAGTRPRARERERERDEHTEADRQTHESRKAEIQTVFKQQVLSAHPPIQPSNPRIEDQTLQNVGLMACLNKMCL